MSLDTAQHYQGFENQTTGPLSSSNKGPFDAVAVDGSNVLEIVNDGGSKVLHMTFDGLTTSKSARGRNDFRIQAGWRSLRVQFRAKVTALDIGTGRDANLVALSTTGDVQVARASIYNNGGTPAIRARLSNPSGNVAAVNVTAGSWNDVLYEYQEGALGRQIRLWVNGTLAGSAVDASPQLGTDGGQVRLYVGVYADAAPGATHDQSIDDVRVDVFPTTDRLSLLENRA